MYLEKFQGAIDQSSTRHPRDSLYIREARNHCTLINVNFVRLAANDDTKSCCNTRVGLGLVNRACLIVKTHYPANPIPPPNNNRNKCACGTVMNAS